jgi:mannose-6-phosphate isomerase-like protein (cupin superfamily)
MELEEFKQMAKLVRDEERYRVYDYPMNEMIVSLTELNPRNETKGHAHSVEEIYYFFEGSGMMRLGETLMRVRSGNVVPIQSNQFHKVFNPSDVCLKYFCFFGKYGDRQ